MCEIECDVRRWVSFNLENDVVVMAMPVGGRGVGAGVREKILKSKNCVCFYLREWVRRLNVKVVW